MNWKITDILFKNNALISAHYFASLSDGQNTVQVEEEVLEQEVLEQAHKASLLLPIPPLLQATCF